MSEALRNALANGDHVAAANAIFDAVSRPGYDSKAVQGLYHVGRMTQRELNAPSDQGSVDPAVDPDETMRVTTRVRLFGSLRR